MTITLSNAFKTACLDGGLAKLNQGSPDGSGDLEFLDNADLSLAVLALNTTAFQPATINGSNAQASSNAISNSGTPTPGTITKGRLRDRSNIAHISFSVSLAGQGGDMTAGAVAIQPGATYVSCSGLVIQAAFA